MVEDGVSARLPRRETARFRLGRRAETADTSCITRTVQNRASRLLFRRRCQPFGVSRGRIRLVREHAGPPLVSQRRIRSQFAGGLILRPPRPGAGIAAAFVSWRRAGSKIRDLAIERRLAARPVLDRGRRGGAVEPSRILIASRRPAVDRCPAWKRSSALPGAAW